MITIRQERSTDIPARERLLDAAFGPARLAKTSERLREGRFAADDLSFVAIENGRLVGTARLWNIAAGIGAMLVKRALNEAKRLNHRAVLLVGDAPYYGRFGFTAEATAALRLPGPFEPERLLGLELKAGALDGARGLARATGQRVPKGLPAFITGIRWNEPIPHAA